MFVGCSKTCAWLAFLSFCKICHAAEVSESSSPRYLRSCYCSKRQEMWLRTPDPFLLFGRVWKTRRKVLTLTSVTPLTHSGGYTANSRALLVGYSDMISHLQCACLQSLHDCHMSTGPVSWWKCPDPIYKRQWGWEVCEKCSLGTNYRLITGCLNYASKTRDTICKTVDGPDHMLL